jgi:protein phosphatase
MVREERVREILADAETLRAALDRLVQEANEAGGRDNITVIAFRIGGEEDATPAPDETVLDLSAAAADGDGTVESVVPAPVPAPVTEQRPAARRSTREEPHRPRRRIRRAIIGLLVVAVLAGATIGALAGLHRVYFLGSDGGLVALYRGVPYDLPFGIHLYQKRYVSSVPVQGLTPTERRRLLDHQLRSKSDAAGLVRGLERGHGL